jgi:hypothetical protein
MTPAAVVLLTAFICDQVRGQPADECEQIEIRAANCGQAAAWLRGWVPPGMIPVQVVCDPVRMAGR